MAKAKQTPEPKEEQTYVKETVEGTIIQLLKMTKRKGINELISYLTNSDFFTAPASTKYHGAYAGGLAEHSLNVYTTLTFLYDNLADSDFNLPEISEDSIILASLLHDLCKVNSYHESFRWTKDEKNAWVQVPEFKREPLLPMGHGAKSLFIAQQFIQLTTEEALAIFWHMGAFDLSNYNTANEMSQAYNDNLLAFLLHQADMTCTYINENEKYQ